MIRLDSNISRNIIKAAKYFLNLVAAVTTILIVFHHSKFSLGFLLVHLKSIKMAKIFIVVLCLFVTVNALRSFDPTEDKRCGRAKNNEKVVFEHESDCSKYYQCKGSLKCEF